MSDTPDRTLEPLSNRHRIEQLERELRAAADEVGKADYATKVAVERAETAERDYADCQATLNDERYCHGQTVASLKNASAEVLKARNEMLKAAEREREEALKLAYIGDHHFPDLTWKARCDEMVSELADMTKESCKYAMKYSAAMQELAEAEADAARYQWLRKALLNPGLTQISVADCMTEDQFDAAIDAAMKEQK